MRKLVIFLALALIVVWALPAFAIPGMGDFAWKVNIIGVQKDKQVPMTNDSRGTIFIPLENDRVSRQVKINYVRGDSFAVLDGNATDDNEATIQVPYEMDGDLCFKVYAVALGKPDKSLNVIVDCAWIDDPNVVPDPVECEDALYQGTFTVNRTKKTPTKDRVTDITGVFVVENVCFTLDPGTANEETICYNDTWIFNIPYFYSYFWDVDNDGLKLMKLYFFETDDCRPDVVIPTVAKGNK